MPKSEQTRSLVTVWTRYLQTALHLWGSPKQLGQMGRKLLGALVAQGPAMVLFYAKRKLQYPYLRFDEGERRPNAEEDVEGYSAWLARCDETASSSSDGLSLEPLISVLMPVFNTDPRWLTAAAESVLLQQYTKWELVIVNDASTRTDTLQVLHNLELAGDSRVSVFHRSNRGGISVATNDALAHASGDYIALLDHDDELHTEALQRVVVGVNEDPTTDVFYTDEDKISVEGHRFAPFFKPDWSPTLLQAMNYVSHLGVYRATLLRSVGGWRSEYDGSQDYDLILRCSERTSRIRHISEILYHWRAVPDSTASSLASKPLATERARRALQEHVQRLGIAADVVSARIPNRHRIRLRIQNWPSIQVVIPTRDAVDLLRACVTGVQTARYSGPVTITIVDNGSRDEDSLAYLADIGHDVKVIRLDEPFNFSRLVNHGASVGTEPLLLFLNNDITMPNADWLEAMVTQACMPGVGVVGAKLLYPDNTVQHAGIVLGLGGMAGHAFWLNARDSAGYFGLQQLAHEVSAVTGACLMAWRDVFQRVGGFPECLPFSYNDVAFCLKVWRVGYRVIYEPEAELIHLESATRARRVREWEEERFAREFDPPVTDPYYSRHLSREPANSFCLPAGKSSYATNQTQSGVLR